MSKRVMPVKHYYAEFPDLVGKVIKRVRWFTSVEHREIAIDFSDNTQASFEFYIGFDVTAELNTRKEDGELDLDSTKELKAVPIFPKNAG